MKYNLRLTIYALALWSVVCGLWSARAGDFTPGYTFSDVETDPNSLVTSNALWRLIGDGTLKTNAVVDRPEITVTATNDFLLIYDASTNLLRRVSLNSLLPTNSVQSWQISTGAVGLAQFGTNFLRNYHFLTNWPDDITLNTNPVVNLHTNSPGTNFFLLTATSYNVGTNGSPTNATLALTPLASVTQSAPFTNAVNTAITNALNAAPTTVAFTNSFPYLTPKPWTNAHGLGRIPSNVRIVYQCLSNIGVWVTGDEIDAENASSGYVWKAHSATATPTNVIVRLYNYNGMNVTTSDATYVGLATNYWRMKMYVTP